MMMRRRKLKTRKVRRKMRACRWMTRRRIPPQV
jgi:hypothetical protein